MSPSRPLATLALALALPALAACGSGGGSGSGGTAAGTGSVAVKATDTTCEVATTALTAGKVTFAVTNGGSKVTEVYVYGDQGGTFTKIVGEVENIGPGLSRDLDVTLPAGTYEVACKPGQTGDGIRTTVTAAGGAAVATPSATEREVELTTDGKSLTGLDGVTAKVGEKLELKLENKADGPRTFEVKRPDGTVAGEIEDIARGEDGELELDIDVAGDWTVIIEGGSKDVTQKLTAS